MKNLVKNLLEKISQKSRKIICGLLAAVAIIAGMFLDSDGKAGWLALGIALLSGVTLVVLLIFWDDKMEVEDGKDD